MKFKGGILILATKKHGVKYWKNKVARYREKFAPNAMMRDMFAEMYDKAVASLKKAEAIESEKAAMLADKTEDENAV